MGMCELVALLQIHIIIEPQGAMVVVVLRGGGVWSGGRKRRRRGAQDMPADLMIAPAHLDDMSAFHIA